MAYYRNTIGGVIVTSDTLSEQIVIKRAENALRHTVHCHKSWPAPGERERGVVNTGEKLNEEINHI